MALLPDRYIVQQKKDWDELFWRFEIKNYYQVLSENSEILFHVIESGSAGTRRAWRSYSLRPFEFSIYDSDKQLLFKIKAPVKYYWHQINIFNSDGVEIGKLEQAFSVFGKSFLGQGDVDFNIRGFWFYWKYIFEREGVELCRMEQSYLNNPISRFLIGTSRFELDFSSDCSDEDKVKILCSSFLIEMLYHDPNN